MLIHTVCSYGRLQASRAVNNHDNVLKRLQSQESREPFCILSEAACRDGDGTRSAPATTRAWGRHADVCRLAEAKARGVEDTGGGCQSESGHAIGCILSLAQAFVFDIAATTTPQLLGSVL